MDTQYIADYSPALGRDMECMVYGHAGRPVLYIPCQDGRFFDFGDFHMAETPGSNPARLSSFRWTPSTKRPGRTRAGSPIGGRGGMSSGWIT